MNQPWVLVRLNNNSSPGIARRIGLDIIRGTLIQYLDSEDIIHDTKFQAQVDYLNQYHDVTMTYGETVTFVQTINEKHQVLGKSNKNITSILLHRLKKKVNMVLNSNDRAIGLFT